ncbi:heavy-metal-associated domain-containing protein [Aerococcaceae bacterium DSM 111020]|nr:heavy-metal-associated domain-containing protein [Aerococcaceae bacterium DSM 111020]
MSKAVLNLETLTCPSCMQKIEGASKALKGVDADSVKVLFNASKVKLDFDESQVSIEEIEKAIENLGYEVLKSNVKTA